MQRSLLKDMYGKKFDKTKVINAECVDFISGKALSEFTEEEIAATTIFIKTPRGDQGWLFTLSDLKASLKAHHYVRLPNPYLPTDDLIEKIPVIKEIVENFESESANYNAYILHKYPHFLPMLITYVQEIITLKDQKRYIDANLDDIEANHSKKLDKFYNDIAEFSEEERAAFDSLFITNREEYTFGPYIDFPIKWVRTDENARLYDQWTTVKASNWKKETVPYYRPFPHRNVLAGDFIRDPSSSCMHSSGMDVLYLLLEYQEITKKEFPIFAESNQYGSKMACHLSKRIKAQNLVADVDKGEMAYQAIKDFIDPINSIVKDLVRRWQKLSLKYAFESEELNNINNLIDDYDDYLISKDENDTKSQQFMMTMMQISKQILETNPSAELKTLLQAFVWHERILTIWPTITTVKELVIASQKIDCIDCVTAIIGENVGDNDRGNPVKAAYADLRDQVKSSDTHTQLADILKKDSLFLKSPVTVEKQNNDRISKQPSLQSPSIQSILFKQPYKSPAFTSYVDNVKQVNPKSVLGRSVNKEEKAWRKKNLAIHTALIKLRQDYLDRGRGKKDLDIIDRLIKDQTDILNTGNAIEYKENAWARENRSIMISLLQMQLKYLDRGRTDHVGHIADLIGVAASTYAGEYDVQETSQKNRVRYDRMLFEIRAAYTSRKLAYSSDWSFCGLFQKTPDQFESRLDKDDNRYCYPRFLRDVLNQYQQTEDILSSDKSLEEEKAYEIRLIQ